MGAILGRLAFLLAFAPFLQGVIGRTKAIAAGRTGPPLLQPYHDIWKLLRKGAVYSPVEGVLFRAGPTVGLACALVAGLLVPLFDSKAPMEFPGDVVLFAYLLGLGRFLTVLAALDTGSSFEGMGASRETAFSAVCESGLLLALAVLCLPGSVFSFAGAGAAVGGLIPHPAVLLAAAALFVVLLAENSRIPVDDPATHLELTMIHEVMVLDHGGPDFAYILLASAVKLFLMSAVLVRLLVPAPAAATEATSAIFLATVLAVGVLVGIVESTMARLRLSRVPQLLFSATALALIALAVLFHPTAGGWEAADALLAAVLVLNLFIASSSRLTACVQACGIQGAALSALPLALHGVGRAATSVHPLAMAAGTFALKAIAIPLLLLRAIREANVRREVEPSQSLTASLLLGAVFTAISFSLGRVLVLPEASSSALTVPAAFATMLVGFLMLAGRRKAVAQVVGFLLLDNGVFVFAQALAREMPLVVELGILLDVLVGVFVMGIAIYHISREFDHIDTDELSTLRD
ncbi:MAG: NADH-quinone oxidoreductase subunit H [Candidatus Wallbacteria bacterium]|nr:NADH-quinone oxidoreductase subunit H [Candidatus Wallbacteria bacterium]